MTPLDEQFHDAVRAALRESGCIGSTGITQAATTQESSQLNARWTWNVLSACWRCWSPDATRSVRSARSITSRPGRRRRSSCHPTCRCRVRRPLSRSTAQPSGRRRRGTAQPQSDLLPAIKAEPDRACGQPALAGRPGRRPKRRGISSRDFWTEPFDDRDRAARARRDGNRLGGEPGGAAAESPAQQLGKVPRLGIRQYKRDSFRTRIERGVRLRDGRNLHLPSRNGGSPDQDRNR